LVECIGPEFRNRVLKEGVDLNARTVSILCQSIERIVVTRYMRFLQNRGREVTAIIHDGLLLAKTDRDETFPREVIRLGEEIIRLDTGFDLSFNQELFEVPTKDAWRFKDETVADLPVELSNIFVGPFVEPPHGPDSQDLRLTRDEFQIDLRQGHSQHVSTCKGRQMLTIAPDGKSTLKCDDDGCVVHPCGSSFPVPDAWRFLFQACKYINVNNNITMNFMGEDIQEGEVGIDPDHLEWLNSRFCYLSNPGKYYDSKSRIKYTKEEFFNRCVNKKTLVRYEGKEKKKVVKKYESARLWAKDETLQQTFFDLTHIPGYLLSLKSRGSTHHATAERKFDRRQTRVSTIDT
jgi:hypothetical protein